MNSNEQSHFVSVIENPTLSPTWQHLMEQLDFSDISKHVEALKAAIFRVAEDRSTKIQFIKEELAAGRYQVQSEQIAERLLEYSHYIEREEEVELA